MISLTGAFLLCLARPSAAAQPPDPDTSISGPFESSNPELYEEIEAEANGASPSHPWAGTYSFSGGFSPSSLVVSPAGRYCFVTFFDFGPTTQAHCAPLRPDGDRIVSGSPPKRWEAALPYAAPYLRVRWGKRRYLVPERGLLEFVNAVNQGTEPSFGRDSSGHAFLRHSDKDILVSGLPDLPPEYRSKLLSRTLMTRAVFVGPRKQVITKVHRMEEEDCSAPARFDAGSSSGVFVGMELYSQEGDRLARGEISAVERETSSALIRQYDCDKDEEIPSGTLFSSRPEWRQLSVASTEPIRIAISFARNRRPPPLSGDSPIQLIWASWRIGLSSAGLVAEEIAVATVTGSFSGALALDESESRIPRMMLSAGANAYDEESPIAGPERDAQSKALGAAEFRRYRLFRLSYRGTPVVPDLDQRMALDSDEVNGAHLYDWSAFAEQAEVSRCSANKAKHAAQRAALLELLRWDETALARAHELTFESLSEERRAAAERLLPPGGGPTGYVWPKVEKALNPYTGPLAALLDAASKEFDKTHPGERERCSLLSHEVWERRHPGR